MSGVAGTDLEKVFDRRRPGSRPRVAPTGHRETRQVREVFYRVTSRRGCDSGGTPGSQVARPSGGLVQTRGSMAFPRTLALFAVSLLALASCESGTTSPVDDEIAQIVVTPQAVKLESLGQTIQFSARAVDEGGDSVPGVAFTWTSYDERVVTVSEDGVAQAVGDGMAPVIAEGGGKMGSAQVTVSIAGLQVSTPVLSNARLTVPYQGVVEAKGGTEDYTFEVTSGSLPSGLDLQPDGTIEGTPSQIETTSFTVRVTDGASDQASRQLSLRVCEAPEDFAVGEVRALAPPAPGACGVFLPAGSGSRYRVALVRTNTEEDESDVATMTLSVTASGEVGGMAASLQRTVVTGRSIGALPPDALQRNLEVARATRALHLRVRRDEEALIRRVGTQAVLPDLRGTGPARAAAQGPLPQKIRIDPTASTSSCDAGTKVTGIKLAENEYMGIYQDSTQNASAATRINAQEAQALLDFYRDHGREVIEAYFGGVPDVNGDGKIVVFIATSLGGTEAGLVWSGNFLSTERCPSSNHMEIIFLNRAVVSDLDDPDSPSQGLETLVHEVKHITSLYQRLQRSLELDMPQFHPSWWEEGTAELAGGVASRLAWSRSGGPAVNEMLDEQDWLDALGGTGQLKDDAQWGVLLRLRRTQEYLASQPNAIVVKPDGSRPQHSVYGSGWMFAMWLGDGFGGAGAAPLGDGPFWAEMNDQDWPSGVAGIEQATGLTWDELLEEYVLALMLNGTGAQPPAHPITTVDFPSAVEVWCFAADNPPCLGQPAGPLGRFPWPVTAHSQSGGTTPSQSFESAVYFGPSGPGGVRVHEFVSDGSGVGSELHAVGPAQSRMVVVRLN